MPTILSIGTAQPEHTLGQEQIKQFANDLYGESFGEDIHRLVMVYDNAAVQQRNFCMPADWFGSSKSFQQKNDLYISNAVDLSVKSARACLAGTDVAPEDIDYILFVSTTGIAVPTIDARLIDQLSLRRTVKRLPIFGAGCAGGANGLARAMELAMAMPVANILLVVTELCGLTFIRNDLSKSALIATSLFADGSASVLVCGDEAMKKHRREHHMPQMTASYTNTMPDSLKVMGWDVGDAGLKIVMSRDIPQIVRTFMHESIDEFLRQQDLALADITHFVTHPGGAKVLQAYEESLGIPPEKLRHAHDMLRTSGNMSACSVIYILQRFLEEIAATAPGQDRTLGILSALGPGFTSELLLLEWGA